MNLGWTKTSVLVQGTDPVTEQPTANWERRFLPGVEFVSCGLFLSAALAGGSFLVRDRTPKERV
jgi:hypothetical protein